MNLHADRSKVTSFTLQRDAYSFHGDVAAMGYRCDANSYIRITFSP